MGFCVMLFYVLAQSLEMFSQEKEMGLNYGKGLGFCFRVDLYHLLLNIYLSFMVYRTIPKMPLMRFMPMSGC